MNITEAIQTRQSDRDYQSTPIEPEKIRQCIESARLAPSACNAQAWKFVVVDNLDTKNKIADCAASMGMNKFLHQAPVIIAIVLEKPNATSRIGGWIQGKEYTLIDIGIAAEHICLQATELGIGSCIIGWFDEKKVKKILQVPKSKKVPLIISLGYARGEHREKVRKPFDAVCSYNQYE